MISKFQKPNEGLSSEFPYPCAKIPSLGPDNQTVTMNGTSQAAPCVSGVAALMFAANNNLTPAQVKSIIEETVQDIVYQDTRSFRWIDRNENIRKSGPWTENAGEGEDPYTGFGMVDAQAAVLKAKETASHEEGETPAQPDPGNENTGNDSQPININDVLIPFDFSLPGNNGYFQRTYDGSKQTPLSGQFTTTDGIVYKENKDYRVTYSNNVNAGINGSLTITGIGALTGIRTVNLVISQCDIASVIQGKTTSYYYNEGKSITPIISFIKSTHTPKLGVDYDVIMGTNKVGKGYATIMGKGNYAGIYQFEYTVQARNISTWYGNLNIANQAYTGKAITPVGSRSATVGGVTHILIPGTDVKPPTTEVVGF